MKTQVKTETIIRTIVTAVTMINMIMTVFDINPLPWSEEELYSGLSAIAAAGSAIWSWWKNNSFTKEAIEADRIMEEMKSGKNN